MVSKVRLVNCILGRLMVVYCGLALKSGLGVRCTSTYLPLVSSARQPLSVYTASLTLYCPAFSYTCVICAEEDSMLSAPSPKYHTLLTMPSFLPSTVLWSLNTTVNGAQPSSGPPLKATC